MAFTYGFFNSLRGDRKYNAEQMSEIFDGILKDGVIPSIGQLFAVSSAGNGMQINVGTGRAWFNHTWSKNDSVMVLRVPDSDITRSRYDAVVLEVNHDPMVRANSIKIVKGESAVNPSKPILVNTDRIHQYPLAYILVKAAVDEIKAADIENMVGRSPTVFATGVLESVSIDHLWTQWEGEFDEWFEQIKLVLSDDVVTNLQYQIDQLNARVPYKASRSEVIEGANDTKYVTPYTAKALVDAEKDTIRDQNGIEHGVGIQNVITASAVSDVYTRYPIRSFNTSGNTYYPSKIYNHAFYNTESVVVDVGDYIVGSWFPESSSITESGYHVIRKSDMYVKSSETVTKDNCYRFIAKATNNAVYYAIGSALYYAKVSSGGLTGVHNITSIPNGTYFVASNDYLLLVSPTTSTLKTVIISSNSVRTFVLPSDVVLSQGKVDLLEDYLFIYDILDDGRISYIRIDVMSGSSMTSSFLVESVAGSMNYKSITVFPDYSRNVSVISCRLQYTESSSSVAKMYFILTNTSGLLWKREVSMHFTSASSFNENEGLILCDNVIGKYTLDNVSISTFSISGLAEDDYNIFDILPTNGFLFIFGGTDMTYDFSELTVLDSSLRKFTPIVIPNLGWQTNNANPQYFHATNLLAQYRNSNSSVLIFSCKAIRAGSSGYAQGEPIRTVYFKVPVETHPLVSIKTS